MSDTNAAIRISLNGEPRTIRPGLTVATLIGDLGLDRRKVAVERNEAIVSRSAYETTAIEHGDQFEIVHFIGGG
jgi:thiamine biosynthesis protein ThiS